MTTVFPKSVILCNDFPEGHNASCVVESFSRAFEKAGYETHVIRSKKDLPVIIDAMARDGKIEFCFDINFRFSDVIVNEKPFYEAYGFPYVSTMDTPFNKVSLIQHLGPRTIVLAVDPGVAPAVHAINHNVHVAAIGTEYVVEDPRPPHLLMPLADRPIDLLFCGNVRLFGKPKRYEDNPFFFDRLISEGMFTNDENIFSIASRMLSTKFCHATFLANDVKQYFDDLWMAMHEIRSARRLAILQQLQIAGQSMRVAIVSDCPHHGINISNVTMLQPRPWLELLELFRHSKIVVHNIPMHVRSLHERLMHTATAGAVIMTDTNKFIRSIFSHKHNAIFYSLQGSNLCAVAKEALQDEAALAQIAANGRSLVLNRCRLQAFVVKLLQYMQLPVYDFDSQACGEQSPLAMQHA